MSEKIKLAIIVLAVMLLITVPYIVGFRASDGNHQFGGFLINPIDGNSYLAKMQQGFQGEWKFRLPYTSEPGEGAYLFLFYVGLGHLARVFGWPLVYVFHAARVLAAGWLLGMIYQLLQATFENNKNTMIGFGLAVFGSGLGWLAVITGAFTSDFWVAEAYPFLSIYTNPHFSLGLGLMIYSLLPKNEERLIANIMAALILALVQPFGVVIIGLVKGIKSALRFKDSRLQIRSLFQERRVWSFVGFCLAGGAVVLYQFWAILTDPVLSQWHLQNITVRPEAIDLIISLSPCLILAVIGVRRAWQSEKGRTMVIWGVICLVLVFIPWSLQRRFLTGIYLPLAILSVFGLQVLSGNNTKTFIRATIVVFFLAIPTNLIVIASGLQAISARNQEIYLSGGLTKSLEWLSENVSEGELVLADEKAGLYIPAWTSGRVIYGHPFETINAAEEQILLRELFVVDQIEPFYEMTLKDRKVDFVLIDRGLEGKFKDWLLANWALSYQNESQQIFSKE